MLFLKKLKFNLSSIALICILVVSCCLSLCMAHQESLIMDELAHIPAGYSYVRYFDYRLNPEHPPLTKMLSAIPLLFLKLNFPLNHSGWTTDVNGQWIIGNQFIYWSGNPVAQLIFLARLGPLFLTLLLTILIYFWSKELLGEKWALLPTFLFAFSPTVLAHGHFVTTDIAAALGITAATYFLNKFFLQPNKKNLIFAGLIFGVAQLAKFSAVLLIPFFIVLTLLWAMRRGEFKKYFLSLFGIFLIGYLLVFAVYGVLNFNEPLARQMSDAQFILGSFKFHWLAELAVNLAGSKIFHSCAQYFLGFLMVLQRSAGGNTAYFLGKISGTGWWYYFPVVFFFKEPLPSLLLILSALLFAFYNFFRNCHFHFPNFKFQSFGYKFRNLYSQFQNYLGLHLSEFSMLFFIIFYWDYSMFSPLNIGVRHILPTIPFIYILATTALKNLVNSSWGHRGLKMTLIFILVFWYLGEALWAFPFELSYFNQLAGGVKNGYLKVTDSNYDWGQDLKRLTDFVEEKNIDKIAVDYFGGGDTKYYLGEKVENWQSAQGNPKNAGIEWLAISINNLQGALAEPTPGFSKKPEDEYRWLKNSRNPLEPDFRAGSSIFIYHL